jgi:hypothetical protein
MGFATDSLGKLREKWASNGKVSLTMNVSPVMEDKSSEKMEYSGVIELEADLHSLQKAEGNTVRSQCEIVCTPCDSSKESFVFQASIKIELVDGKSLAAIVSLEPRAQLVNTMPVSLTLLTKGRNIFSPVSFSNTQRDDTVHELEPGEKAEIFSSGEDFALKVRCSNKSMDGTPTGTTAEWIHLPLSSASIPKKPVRCVFPFEGGEPSSQLEGNEFFFAAASNTLPDFFLERINDEKDTEDAKTPATFHGPKTYLATVGNYGKMGERN